MNSGMWWSDDYPFSLFVSSRFKSEALEVGLVGLEFREIETIGKFGGESVWEVTTTRALDEPDCSVRVRANGYPDDEVEHVLLPSGIVVPEIGDQDIVANDHGKFEFAVSGRFFDFLVKGKWGPCAIIEPELYPWHDPAIIQNGKMVGRKIDIVQVQEALRLVALRGKSIPEAIKLLRPYGMADPQQREYIIAILERFIAEGMPRLP